jgi:ribosomal protein S20
LAHRVFLAETITSETASKLGATLEEDNRHDMAAFQELQDKVAECQAIEYHRADILRDFLQNLREEKLKIQGEILDEVQQCEYDLKHSVEDTLVAALGELYGDVQMMKDDVAKTLIDEREAILEDVRDQVQRRENLLIDRCLNLMEGLCTLAGITFDAQMFKQALIHESQEKDVEEALRLRFLNSCSLTRIDSLQKALDEAQNAEAKAKRLALRISQKRDQELEAERSKVETLSRRLDTALEALEKARNDFESVSVVVEELNRGKKE